MTIETLWSPNLGVIEHKFVKKLTLTDFDESKDVGRYVCFVQIGEKLIPEMAELNVVKATGELHSILSAIFWNLFTTSASSRA